MKCQKSGRHSRRKTCQCSSVLVLPDTVLYCFFEILLSGINDKIDKLVIAGCDPNMQRKMFRDAFENAGFDKSKHVGVDIRNMTTEQAMEAIKKVLI